MLVYLVLSGRLCGDATGDGREDRLLSSAVSAAAEARRRRREEAREKRRQRKEQARARARAGRPWPPERAPDGWGAAAAVAARTVRFTWAETLGKWALGELAFGIKYHMRQQVRPLADRRRRTLLLAAAFFPIARRGMVNLFLLEIFLKRFSTLGGDWLLPW